MSSQGSNLPEIANTNAAAASSYANAAFGIANTATTNATTADTKAVNSGSYANSAYGQANTATTNAATATTNAATADTKAVNSGSYANSAFTKANNAVASSGGTISGDLSVTGNLTVQGQQTYVNTQTVLIADNIITVNAAINQASAPAFNAGIEVDRGSSANVSLLWNETTDKWVVTNDGTNYFNIASDAAETYANSAFSKANNALTAASNTATSVQFGSLGIGTAASGTSGEIRATNNITAYYSDDRLKTKLGNIENALQMLTSLNGFYYEANKTAQDLGYTVQREVGLSAQEVQKVLPEIVVPAPIDDKYLTIHYEKLIPLLVEAIKELNDKINNK